MEANLASKIHAVAALVTVILIADGLNGVAANGPCSNTLSSLSACMPAIEGENPQSPSVACCDVVRGSDASCLCSIVTTYANLTDAMGINLRAALLLPKQCKRAVPSGFTCGGYVIPPYASSNRKLMTA
ncbi:uncharacterized protein [Physcomitrium patens]|uniref:Bifunctional inhibitor/plant lipid transfer protein/seed storage helical domain-containing protein n=1 Tax=Physcomitrium patens TaxID=3218 RepID=A9SLN1_PHYPA|nr:putative lipid-transfer protein DIR1 [Physcomitrium patens]PNR43627.1 hypothetical protein PHYPA_016008 [Physcomitrium patens]|eukprot:XP_024390184.1 putative lipid-transfer protein DIR1 [Physcomitrella patens]